MTERTNPNQEESLKPKEERKRRAPECGEADKIERQKRATKNSHLFLEIPFDAKLPIHNILIVVWI
jgi:hypothetical protein